MRQFFLVLALWAAPVAAQQEATEGQCSYVIRSGFMLEGLPAPGLHILHRGPGARPMREAIPTSAERVGCERSALVLGPDDDEVVRLGIPLTIVETGTRRGLVLVLSQGRYAYTLLQGPLSPAERAALDARITQFQARLPARP